MPNIFDRVKETKPRMSAFDLSREQKLSCSMAELIPTYVDEVVPGDQFRVQSEIMMRVAPMIAPLMHRVNVYMHYFFVPNRLVWSQWEDFITGGQDGLSSPTIPVFDLTTINEGSLMDYFGLPTIDGSSDPCTVSQLPFRAYQLIWNEYYRDPNLHEEIDVETVQNSTLRELRKRCWEKDYFTSALPWTQRGPESEINVQSDFTYKDHVEVGTSSGIDPATGGTDGDVFVGSDNGTFKLFDSDSVPNQLTLDNIESIDGVNFSINDLRRSTALQRWLEKQARGGYRYIETILSHFGIRSEDYRLQRPEYLGGGKQPIQISEVLNTSATATEPQGDMSGHGISVGKSNVFQKQFKEHGYVMGIMSVLPKTAYFQGVPKHFLRDDKHDFYWPEFANLGEQEVKNKELYFDRTDDGTYNDGTFGYQQRYAEYKYGRSTIHGDFRGELDFWHMGRKFSSQPNLNSEFVEADPTDRIFAVQDGTDTLWVQLYHDVKARRPMPYFADPRL